MNSNDEIGALIDVYAHEIGASVDRVLRDIRQNPAVDQDDKNVVLLEAIHQMFASRKAFKEAEDE